MNVLVSQLPLFAGCLAKHVNALALQFVGKVSYVVLLSRVIVLLAA